MMHVDKFARESRAMAKAVRKVVKGHHSSSIGRVRYSIRMSVPQSKINITAQFMS